MTFQTIHQISCFMEHPVYILTNQEIQMILFKIPFEILIYQMLIFQVFKRRLYYVEDGSKFLVKLLFWWSMEIGGGYCQPPPSFPVSIGKRSGENVLQEWKKSPI